MDNPPDRYYVGNAFLGGNEGDRRLGSTYTRTACRPHRPGSPARYLSSAIRLFVLDHYRRLAEKAALAPKAKRS